VSINNRTRSFLLVAATAAFLAATPTLAEAQRRRVVVRGPAVRSVIYVAPYYRYSRFYYDPWYQWGYPYGSPFPPYGYRYGGYYEFNASVRIQATPREAEVFVDGYRAGTVDDFDGTFQRLRLRPGGHEITVFLEGHETVKEALYLEAGADRKLQFTMNRLAAGDRSEPPPAPSGPEPGEATATPRPMPAPRATVGVRPEPSAEPAQAPVGRFGTLSIRVQPADADVFVDGERWASPGGQDRVSIQLSEGRHRIEVRREGMTTYAEDILIRRGATFTLNVSLK
jgi:hypothetical protein